MPLFRAAEDDFGLARVWRLRSEVRRLVCHFGEEAAALEQALAHAQAAGEEREATEIRLWLGNCLCYGPMPVGKVIARCQEMLEHAHGVRWVEASTLGMLAYLHAMADHPAEARSCYARTRAIFEELGMTFALAARAIIPAEIERMAGDLEAAERELVVGHDQLEAIGENELRSTIAATLGQCSTTRAATTTRSGSPVPARARRPRTTSARRCCGGRRSPRSSRAGTARPRPTTSPLEAVRLAATTDMLSLHGAALLDLARVSALLNGGKPPGHIVEEAIRLFERKEDAASLRRAALEFADTYASSRV